MYAKQTGVISQLIKFIPHGYMSSYPDGRRGWGHRNHMGVAHSWCYKTRAATKECRKLNNTGGIMVVMETSFASSTAVFYLLLAVGHTHAETVQRAKFTSSFLQEHM